MKDKIIVIAKVIIQFLICIVLSFIVTIAVEYISKELLLFFYMRANKINHLRDLSDDYGLGMLFLLQVFLVFIISMPISFLIIWKLLKRLFHKLKIN